MNECFFLFISDIKKTYSFQKNDIYFFLAIGTNGFLRDRSTFFVTGQTGSGQFKNFRDGTNGIGTIQKFSWRDKRDSGLEKVCPADLYWGGIGEYRKNFENFFFGLLHNNHSESKGMECWPKPYIENPCSIALFIEYNRAQEAMSYIWAFRFSLRMTLRMPLTYVW